MKKYHIRHCERSAAISKLRNILIILLLFFAGSFFLLPQKAKAEVRNIVINEIMVDPAPTDVNLCKSDSCEWVELFNNSDNLINLKNWSLDGKIISSDVYIEANDFLIVTKNITDFNLVWTGFDQAKITQLPIVLTNTGKTLILKSNDGYEEDFKWLKSSGANISWEKMDSAISSLSEQSDDSNWFLSLDFGGTPGAENSVSKIEKPVAPDYISPSDNATFLPSQIINFSWLELEGTDYELQISKDESFSSLIENSDLEIGKYFWKVIAQNPLGIVYTIPRSFEIVEPEYSDEVLRLVNLENTIIRQVKVSRIIDGDTIEVTGLEGNFSSIIRLLFVDTPEKDEPFYESASDFTEQLLGQTVDLMISRNIDEQKDNEIYDRTLAVIIFQNKVFNTQLLEQGLASFYDIDNSVLIYDEWLAILQKAQKERIGLWESTSSLILSELLPNPVGEDVVGEWIEIYNPSDNRVVLSRFFLDKYSIPSGTSIDPRSFLVLPRSQTETVLNNTGDTISLFFPGGLLINKTIYGQSMEGLSWALGSDGKWSWTTTPTPRAKNVITVPVIVTDQTDEPIINTIPIEISTGDHQNYLDKLVKIRGKVISTSGNTFYLDDGSGVVKVYIQEKTGIEKPEMHRNDIFEIIGVVDLYGQTWRVLPRILDDIILIETAPVVTKVTATKKVVAKVVTAAKSPLISKAVAAASTSPPPENKDKNSSLIQLIMTSIGLAVLSLFFLIIKILNQPKVKSIGGHFGDDET